jgi:hypothetical protein
VLRMLNAMVEDDPSGRTEFLNGFKGRWTRMHSVDTTVWSDKTTFKLNSTVNRHNCTYWSSEKPNIHVGKAVNLPVVTVWCGVSSRCIVGPYFFQGTVSGAECPQHV